MVRLRKPSAISQSEANSISVRSDCVGILSIARVLALRLGDISPSRSRPPGIPARRGEGSGAARDRFREALCPAAAFLCPEMRIVRRLRRGIDQAFAGSQQFLGCVPALAIDAAQFERAGLPRLTHGYLSR